MCGQGIAIAGVFPNLAKDEYTQHSMFSLEKRLRSVLAHDTTAVILPTIPKIPNNALEKVCRYL